MTYPFRKNIWLTAYRNQFGSLIVKHEHTTQAEAQADARKLSVEFETPVYVLQTFELIVEQQAVA